MAKEQPIFWPIATITVSSPPDEVLEDGTQVWRCHLPEGTRIGMSHIQRYVWDVEHGEVRKIDG